MTFDLEKDSKFLKHLIHDRYGVPVSKITPFQCDFSVLCKMTGRDVFYGSLTINHKLISEHNISSFTPANQYSVWVASFNQADLRILSSGNDVTDNCQPVDNVLFDDIRVLDGNWAISHVDWNWTDYSFRSLPVSQFAVENFQLGVSPLNLPYMTFIGYRINISR